MELDRGGTVPEPEGFHVDGYTLDGWCTSKSCSKTKKWGSDDKLYTSKKLFAKWTRGMPGIDSLDL